MFTECKDTACRSSSYFTEPILHNLRNFLILLPAQPYDYLNFEFTAGKVSVIAGDGIYGNTYVQTDRWTGLKFAHLCFGLTPIICVAAVH